MLVVHVINYKIQQICSLGVMIQNSNIRLHHVMSCHVMSDLINNMKPTTADN